MKSSGPQQGSGVVVVVGSLNTDLTVRTTRFPEPGETLSGSELVTAPGGKSSNQAAAAAILGSTVRLIGAVGADGNGDFLLHQAANAGVDVSAVQRLDDHATGSAMIVVNDNGENTIIVSPGSNGALTPSSIRPDHVAEAAVLCLCLEVPVDTVLTAARAGHDAGAEVIVNLSPFAEVPIELLTLTDVLLVNRSEADLVLGTKGVERDWEAALEGFRALGVERTIVTLGEDGSVVLDGRTDAVAAITPIEATRVEAVDTTGSGDAFTGAVAHGLAAGASLIDAARFASEASALAATADGAQSSYAQFAHLSS